MNKPVKQNPHAENSSREKMFRIAEAARAIRIPASQPQDSTEKAVSKTTS